LPVEADARTQQRAPAISVVLATRDRPDHLERALGSLLAIRYPRFEMVIVDQGGASATAAVISEVFASAGLTCTLTSEAPNNESRFANERLLLRHVTTSTRGLSRARNLGSLLAQGQIFAYTDDDCTVEPDWLERIDRAFARDADVGVICGTVRPIAHDPDQLYVPVFTPSHSYVISRKNLLSNWPWGMGVGANLCVRRSAFVAAGGFDVRLGAGTAQASGEDKDFVYRVLRRNYRVLVDADNIVTHWGARYVGDGTAARLLSGSWSSIGVTSALLLRQADPFALLMLARVLGASSLGALLGALRRRSRPTVDVSTRMEDEFQRHVRQVAAGFICGLRLNSPSDDVVELAQASRVATTQ
jgi:GT2 family glycosyltransferase